MTGSADPHSQDLRAARRTAVLVVVAIVVGVVGVVIGATSDLMRDDDAEPTATTVARGGLDDPTVQSTLGPRPGTSLDRYLIQRRTALGQVDGEVTAVVSFAEYHTAQSVRDIARAHDLELLAQLVALPGGPSVTLEDDVEEWVAEQVAAAEEERDALAELLPTVDDPEFIQAYEQDIARLDVLIAAGDPGGAVAFAMAVRGDSGALRALAEDPGVRLVDVGSDVSSTTTFRGVRPDEVQIAGEPELRT